MKLSWNWLKEYVSVSAPVETVAERLTMAGLEVKKVEKIGGDYRLETEITSNRPDWLSHIGVAREIAALFDRPLRIPKATKVKRSKTSANFSITTPDIKLCPYYSANILEGLKLVKTPDEMRERLEVCGLRSINFIVDVTNYVLLECGQPLHAFDLQKLSGTKLSARKAKDAEQIIAINGAVCKLDQADCVISSETKPVAIGGVMGGRDSEVSDNTQNILIESAYFIPGVIRKTSKRLKLTSDSSYRFERGVDPLGVDWARERATALIAEFCRPSAVGFSLSSGRLPVRKSKVVMELSEVSRVLGIQIASGKIMTMLNRLGLRSTLKGGKLAVEVPSFRSDITQPVDLIEEIARIYGYDRIPAALPKISIIEPAENRLLKVQEDARNLSIGLGLQEVVTFSVINPDTAVLVDSDQANWVRIDNPRNNQLTLMRPNFITSLLQVIRHNLNAGVVSAAIFEIGNRYWFSGKDLPAEDRTLAVALAGETPLHWMNKVREYNFFHLKGVIDSILSRYGDGVERLFEERPYFLHGESFKIVSGRTKIGEFGTVKKQCLELFGIEKPVYFGEISLSELSKLNSVVKTVREPEKHPSTRRDLSLLVEDKVQSENLVGAIKSLGNNLIRQVDIFDLYRGGNIEKGKKSISFRITYQADDRTLQAEEVNQLHFSIVDSLSNQYSAKLH